MYSLNAPVPAPVARLASGLAADLLDASVRQRHTLVVKRLGEDDPGGLADAAWTVDRLQVWAGDYDEPVESIALP